MLKFSVAVFLAGMITGKIYFDSLVAGVIISLGLSFLYPEYLKMEEEKRKRTLLLQFKDLLYSISASMALGRNMKQALEESLVFWQNIYSEDDIIVREVRSMLKEMEETNSRDIDVLRAFALRSGLPDIMDFVNIYEAARQTGGNMPRAISRATSVIGDKISMERELDVALKEKHTEGRIVGLAPFIMTAAMRAFSPGYMSPLYDSFTGVLVAACSLGLSVIAIVMIERINKIDF